MGVQKFGLIEITKSNQLKLSVQFNFCKILIRFDFLFRNFSFQFRFDYKTNRNYKTSSFWVQYKRRTDKMTKRPYLCFDPSISLLPLILMSIPTLLLYLWCQWWSSLFPSTITTSISLSLWFLHHCGHSSTPPQQPPSPQTAYVIFSDS